MKLLCCNIDKEFIFPIILVVFLINQYVLCFSLVQELKGKPLVIKKTVMEMLETTNYLLSDENIEIQYRPVSIIIIANTHSGKKFLKLHDKNNGIREWERALFISNYLPIIKPECLICRNDLELIIQPYIEQINEKILFNIIEKVDTIPDFSLTFIDSMFTIMRALVTQTLNYTITLTNNDHLYIHRLKTKNQDQESGRIESFYINRKFNIAGLEINWEELLKKKFSVDGITYKETLEDLLELAKEVLDPKNPRLIATCHGYWHEMNVYIDKLDGINSTFCFFDCEYSGINDVIGDAIVYLMYNSVLTAYLGPKYYLNQFLNIPGIVLAQKKFDQKKRNIQVTADNQKITLSGIYNFGISNIRKQITKHFIQKYLNHILEKAKQQFSLTSDILEDKIKSCIIVRVLGVYNIALMEPMDQAKILGLLFKVVATPIDSINKVSTLMQLENAL